MDAEQTFGEWIEDQYLSRGWTQTEFAAMIGVAQNTVSSWIASDPRPKKPQRRRIPKIAAILEVPEAEILRRLGFRPLRAAEAEFRSLAENKLLTDELRDLRVIQAQLARAMELIQVAMDRRGVVVADVENTG